jgi:beta-lactamase class D
MKKKLVNFVTLALIAAGLNLTNATESKDVEEKRDVRPVFIAKKDNKVIKTIGDCDIQNPPCSTFKVALALMGFDAGILIDKDSPRWPFKQEYEKSFQSWYKPEMGVQYGWHGEHTPATFMQNSVVWFSHQITQRLGKEKFQAYINKLDYGNRDVSGTPGQDDGLLNSWLETSLKISPREQVEFLEKMLNHTLDLSKNAQDKTIEIMVKKDKDGQPVEWDGWKVYGKTGGGTGCNRWFIGWVEKGKEKIIFAQYIGLEKDTPELRASAPMAIDAAKENIMSLIK